MDLDGLLALLDQIRNGRSEDTSTEWKECWWAFNVAKSAAEFIKDVAAMANANTRDERVIVVGIGRGGVPQHAPLPEDEAGLQQRLQAMTPTPHVVFRQLALPGGQVLTVIEVQEPFDKPYVATTERNLIFVRQGSTTTTATRGMLDDWYLEKRKPPELALDIEGTRVEDGGLWTVEREQLVAEPEPPWPGVVRVAARHPFAGASLEERVVHDNHAFWLSLGITNVGSTAAEDVVADFEITGVRKLALYDTDLALPAGLVVPHVRPTWATNPAELCYVDEHRVRDGKAFVRQRLRRVNPGLRESFNRLGLLAAEVTPGAPLRFEVRYHVNERNGLRLQGAFHVDVRFNGQRVVPRTGGGATLGI